MRTCTCPDCGGELIVTCEQRCARAAAGVRETTPPSPGVLAARANPQRDRAHAAPRRGLRTRGDSVSTVVARVVADGNTWTVPTLHARVAAERPGATASNVFQSVALLVRAGVVERVARGAYRVVGAP